MDKLVEKLVVSLHPTQFLEQLGTELGTIVGLSKPSICSAGFGGYIFCHVRTAGKDGIYGPILGTFGIMVSENIIRGLLYGGYHPLAHRKNMEMRYNFPSEENTGGREDGWKDIQFPGIQKMGEGLPTRVTEYLKPITN